MRVFLISFLLISVALIPVSSLAVGVTGQRAHGPTVPDDVELVSTIDELAAMFNSEQCAECHEEIYEQWKNSGKFRSFSTERVRQTWRTFIKQGLERETKADWSGEPVNRMSLKSHCLWCHEPRIKYATDELVAEIIDMIVASVDDPDKAKRDEAVQQLSKLNLGCYGCHNMFAIKDGYWGNKPVVDAIYGPTGEVDQTNHQENVEGINQTLKSEYLKESKYCARCHHGCPDSVPHWQCRTLYTSYLENYKTNLGGDKRCQDCHMPIDPEIEMASHRFPGVHDKEFFGNAMDIGIKAEITHFINNYKNELTPTLCLDVILTSKSGHGLPNG
jgi:hypothetical protein